MDTSRYIFRKYLGAKYFKESTANKLVNRSNAAHTKKLLENRCLKIHPSIHSDLVGNWEVRPIVHFLSVGRTISL